METGRGDPVPLTPPPLGKWDTGGYEPRPPAPDPHLAIQGIDKTNLTDTISSSYLVGICPKKPTTY